MIKIGDRLPGVTLFEHSAAEGNGCVIGPNPVDVAKAVSGKRIALFAVPGAFTPTCSAQHLPGYVAGAADLRAAGIDEIWCISVNDAFVLGAWGSQQRADGVLRLLADGSAAFTTAVGLTLDLVARGMGVRSQRYSMLVVDGVVRALNVETPGMFEVSGADTLLRQARELS